MWTFFLNWNLWKRSRLIDWWLQFPEAIKKGEFEWHPANDIKNFLQTKPLNSTKTHFCSYKNNLADLSHCRFFFGNFKKIFKPVLKYSSSNRSTDSCFWSNVYFLPTPGFKPLPLATILRFFICLETNELPARFARNSSSCSHPFIHSFIPCLTLSTHPSNPHWSYSSNDKSKLIKQLFVYSRKKLFAVFHDPLGLSFSGFSAAAAAIISEIMLNFLSITYLEIVQAPIASDGHGTYPMIFSSS